MGLFHQATIFLLLGLTMIQGLTTKKDVYDGCSDQNEGNKKFCLGIKTECMSKQDCTILVGVDRMNHDTYRIRLMGDPPTNNGDGYIAFGLNKDPAMAGAHLFECVKKVTVEGPNYNLFTALGKGHFEPAKEEMKPTPNVLQKREVENVLICEWTMAAKSTLGTSQLDLINEDYFFLVSYGPSSGVSLEHHVERVASGNPFSLKSLSWPGMMVGSNETVQIQPGLQKDGQTTTPSPSSSPPKVQILDRKDSIDNAGTTNHTYSLHLVFFSLLALFVKRIL